MTSATAEEQAVAKELLYDLVMDPYFMGVGQRNDDAVNLCIALRVLGLGDPIEWFKTYCDEHRESFTIEGRARALEHIERVKPYAESWGPVGNEGNALDYRLD